MMKDGERVEPKDFELLKVLGQGSFGKVGFDSLNEHSVVDFFPVYVFRYINFFFLIKLNLDMKLDFCYYGKKPLTFHNFLVLLPGQRLTLLLVIKHTVK